MANSMVERVTKSLSSAGLNQTEMLAVQKAIIESFPVPVYKWAVIFLGLATLLLVVGGTALLFKGVTVPGELWVALGAGLGALGGIFTGNKE